jgi:hypothetical protein
MKKYEIASEAFAEASKNEKNNKKKDFYQRRATLMKEMSCQN